MTTLRDKAAAALDESLGIAVAKHGIYTDVVRDTLARYLDGRKVPTRYVRRLIAYLHSISRPYDRRNSQYRHLI